MCNWNDSRCWCLVGNGETIYGNYEASSQQPPFPTFCSRKTLVKPWPSSHSHVKPSYASDRSAVGKIAECTEQCFGRCSLVTSWPSGAELWRFHNPHGELEHGPFSSLIYPWKMVIFRYVNVYRRVIQPWIQFGFFKHQTYGACDW